MNDPLKIFVDSDAFVALAVQTDTNHKTALSLLENLEEKQIVFFTSNYVFSESVTVISQRGSHEAAIRYITSMQSHENPFVVHRINEPLEAAAVEIFKRQTSKNVSFIDCTNMALMKYLQADAIFSFDGGYKTNKFTLIADFLKSKEENNR